MTQSGGYQINEHDIDSILRFLRATDPKNATPDMAIELLERLKASVHTMAHEDPETLQEIYEDLKEKKEL